MTPNKHSTLALQDTFYNHNNSISGKYSASAHADTIYAFSPTIKQPKIR